MARGILGGIVFGGIVSVAAAGAISVLLDPPTRPDVAAEAPSSAGAPAASDKQADAGYGDADLVTEGGGAQVSAPAPEDVSAAAAASVDTPRVPEAGGAESPSFSNGGDGSETALAALPQSEPVLPAPQAALPNAPGAEAELSISTEPAQPPAPTVEDPLDNVEPGALDAPQALETPVVASVEPAIPELTQDDQTATQVAVTAPQAPTSDLAPSADQVAAAPPTPAPLPVAANPEDIAANEELSEPALTVEEQVAEAPAVIEGADVEAPVEVEEPAAPTEEVAQNQTEDAALSLIHI